MADQAQTAEEQENEEKIPRKVNMIVVGWVIGLLLLVAGAVYFSFKFVDAERERELQAWQIRLGIVADGRAAAVSEWVDQNFATLRELTENASLQLYLTELSLAQGDKSAVTDEPAQATFLRNLLVATSERSGFKPPVQAGEVSANVEKAGSAGLGLINGDGQPLVATPYMPLLQPKQKAMVANALEGKPAVIDVHKGGSNLPTVGFALPIFGVQADEGAKGIGAVVGLRVLGRDLFNRLKQPGETSKTSETYLIRKEGRSIQYISPLADGTAPLERSLTIETPELVDAYVLERPGGFAVRRDYKGTDVLFVSRAIANLPWILVRKISRAEALEATETRLKTILIVFVLIIIGVTVAIIAVWRHGTSVRATQAAERFRISSERFENISKFMRLVTNSQPNEIAAVDGTTTYTFANEPAAAVAGITPEDMMGKTMASVMGPVKAKFFEQVNRNILRNFADLEEQELPDSRERARESHVHTFEGEDDSFEVIKSDHIPLRGDRDHPPGVLMVLSDITELTHERRRSEQMTRQLINTIVNVVDQRDPYSSHHSSRVAQVARAIAEEMDLSQEDANTVDLAGNLLSLGKIFVPTVVLGKGEEDMTPEENSMVANSYMVSAELLKDIPFDGPVVEAIRQSGERVDGAGPLGLKDEQILMTARIVNVANMFVRKISARAYREGLTFEEVSNVLLQSSGTQFDRKPVSALINFLDNHGGMEKWAHLREKPPEAAE